MVKPKFPWLQLIAVSVVILLLNVYYSLKQDMDMCFTCDIAVVMAVYCWVFLDGCTRKR